MNDGPDPGVEFFKLKASVETVKAAQEKQRNQTIGDGGGESDPTNPEPIVRFEEAAMPPRSEAAGT